jgi:hypothetical protein
LRRRHASRPLTPASLRDARYEKHREEAHNKVEELKDTLHDDRKPATTGS